MAEMTQAHKDKLDRGRKVARYLSVLDGSYSPPAGRAGGDPTERLRKLDAKIKDAKGVTKLKLLKAKRDLENAPARTPAAMPDPADYEAEFCKVAAAYAKDNGYTYEDFTALGVKPAVLTKAKIKK